MQSSLLLVDNIGKMLSGVSAKMSRMRVCDCAWATSNMAAAIRRERIISFIVVMVVVLHELIITHARESHLLPRNRNTMPSSTSNRSMALLRIFFSWSTNAPMRKLTTTLPRRIILTMLTMAPSMLKAWK